MVADALDREAGKQQLRGIVVERPADGPADVEHGRRFRIGAVQNPPLGALDGQPQQLGNVLGQWLPARLAEGLLLANGFEPDARLPDMADAKLRKLGDAINRWAIVPTGSEGYKKAEVTLGGVDTRELSQQTMMANKVPGLYFIGETVDDTGWLGGYNFQWAWASGFCAGRAV